MLLGPRLYDKGNLWTFSCENSRFVLEPCTSYLTLVDHLTLGFSVSSNHSFVIPIKSFISFLLLLVSLFSKKKIQKKFIYDVVVSSILFCIHHFEFLISCILKKDKKKIRSWICIPFKTLNKFEFSPLRCDTQIEVCFHHPTNSPFTLIVHLTSAFVNLIFIHTCLIHTQTYHHFLISIAHLSIILHFFHLSN